MAIDVGSIQTFTDEELIVIYRLAMATGAYRQSITIGGRTLNVPGPKEVRDTIDWLESRGTVGDDSLGGAALVQYGERV